MTRLLIPTRNRPTAARNMLAFLAQFYPNTKVTLADGSASGYDSSYARAVDEFRDVLAIDYRRYNPDLLFFDRLLDVLRSLNDELIIIGADDDFPMMDTLHKGSEFLRNNSSYMGAGGSLIHITHITLADGYRLTARFGQTRTVRGSTPVQRAREYDRWYFPTTYSVTRREHAIERYERCARLMRHSGFYDYVIGLWDCIRQEYKGLPDVGFICTRNDTHSYWRWEDQFFYLRHGEEVIELMDKFRDKVLALQVMSEEEALSTSRLIQTRVVELAGWPTHSQAGFMHAKLFLDPVIQHQYKIFIGMFEDGNPERARFLERLRVILRSLEDNAYSDDNKGEAAKYETITGSRIATP